MEFIFLGTGTSQGVPIITCSCKVCLSSDERDKRLRTSAYIHYKGLHIVIDAGPDFRQQMLRNNIRNVDAILLTHAHRDHIAGLDDIRPYNFSKQKPMDIYAEKPVIEIIHKEFSYVFQEITYPGVPQMNMVEITEAPFYINNLKIEPIRAIHMHLPILGFRIGKLAYITDASYIPHQEFKKLENLEVLIINCLRYKKHYSHFNYEEAVQHIKTITPQKAYLTHLSHEIGLYSEIEKNTPKNVYFSYDGMKLIISD